LNINEIGNARQTMFNVKMNKVEDTVGGKTTLDKKGNNRNKNLIIKILN
jgi:hypothetical protein